jgi:hypothetical protein
MQSTAIHQKWYGQCPGIQLGIALNLLITVLAILFFPVIFLLGGIFGVGRLTYEWYRCTKRCTYKCITGERYPMYWTCRRFLALGINLTLAGLIYLPCCLALAVVGVVLAIVIGTIPFLFCCLSYLVRLLYTMIRLECF